MDETPVFFDMLPEKSLVQKGQKSVTIRTSGSKKRHLTVVHTVAADGFILPPMKKFRGKTNETTKDIEAPEDFVIGWVLDVNHQVWKSYAEKKTKEIGFQQTVNGIGCLQSTHNWRDYY